MVCSAPWVGVGSLGTSLSRSNRNNQQRYTNKNQDKITHLIGTVFDCHGHRPGEDCRADRTTRLTALEILDERRPCRQFGTEVSRDSAKRRLVGRCYPPKVSYGGLYHVDFSSLDRAWSYRPCYLSRSHQMPWRAVLKGSWVAILSRKELQVTACHPSGTTGSSYNMGIIFKI